MTDATPCGPGRPSTYTEELGILICARLADGKGLKAICEDDDMPARSTVYEWLDAHREFRTRYARARDIQADHHADEIIEIADAVTTAEQAQIARVKIGAREWKAAKLAPKRYGDRLELAGEVGLARVSSAPLDREAWAKKHKPT